MIAAERKKTPALARDVGILVLRAGLCRRDRFEAFLRDEERTDAADAVRARIDTRERIVELTHEFASARGKEECLLPLHRVRALFHVERVGGTFADVLSGRHVHHALLQRVEFLQHLPSLFEDELLEALERFLVESLRTHFDLLDLPLEGPLDLQLGLAYCSGLLQVRLGFLELT
jgi:hypothetical protein